jgi:hypothetical protein
MNNYQDDSDFVNDFDEPQDPDQKRRDEDWMNNFQSNDEGDMNNPNFDWNDNTQNDIMNNWRFDDDSDNMNH